MNYLFLFTISPVQTFIAQARKTRDLYAGSQILSELCQVAATEIKDIYKGTIIFPSLGNESIPNRFIAKISEQSTDLQEIGKNIEDKVQQCFEEMAQKALKNSPAKNKKKPHGFDEQIKNHLDIHWAFYPIENDYATAYRELERFLGAIKNVRTFEQFSEQGRKCSLDGERNALFYRCRELNGKTDKPSYILQTDAIEITASRLRPNEGLSAVSFLKRYYQFSEPKTQFASTADIALMKYKEDIKADDAGKKLINYFDKHFYKDDLDGQLYYEENLTEKYFEKNGLNEYLKKNKDLISEIQKKLEAVNKLSFKKTRYYATLVFDGDDMGKWLSGEILSENADLESFHQMLSQQVGQFAQAAREFLDEPYGQTIYAGGDDFLGFVNLNYLFKVIKHLRELFDREVNQPLKEKFDYKKTNLTFSAGILIAHYKTPLHVVLLRAKGLENTAKNYDDQKNAFAIAVMKHSGESHESRYKWQDADEKWNIDRIDFLVQQLQENFSDTFIRNLNQELRLLVDENGQIKKNHEMVYIEMKRLLKRSLQTGKPKCLVDELCEELKNLYSQSLLEVTNFLEILNIANFIRKEITATNSHT